MKYRAELKGRDLLEAEIIDNRVQLKAVGCSELLNLIKSLKAREPDIQKWQLPDGNAHSELLLRELLMKIRGEWHYPYEHLELCHCRAIPTENVDQAILGGAHTPEKVSRWTSASTACGTCRADVEKILEYRLKKGA
jgi:bacterioferritin-associated ferredoxin